MEAGREKLIEENKKFPCLKALNIQFRYLKTFSTTAKERARERSQRPGGGMRAGVGEDLNERKFMNEIRPRRLRL